MKSSLILFLVFVRFLYSHPGDENIRHEPFLKLKDTNGEILKNFRFDDNRSYYDLSSPVIEKQMCPAETDQDVSNLEEASKLNYKLKYCLFRKFFKKGEERICKKEVKPIFVESFDPETRVKKCGFAEWQTIHFFAYYDCGNLNVLGEFQRLVNRLDPTSFIFPRSNWYTYQICYDKVEKKVLWTKHFFHTPQIFQNPYLQNQQLSETEISTNSYYMDDDLFLRLKKQYELETQKDKSKPDTFIMVPQAIVPSQHFAFATSKKNTNHYINMAPLWEKLVPLVNAIDEGIINAQLKLGSSSPTFHDSLIILTQVSAATAGSSTSTSSKVWFNLLIFEGNIWYKFVHRMRTMSAVLIIIYNIPGNPPSIGCPVGNQKACNFQTWSKDEQVRESITEDVIQYAYCCEVPTSHIRNMFGKSYVFNKFLNIDSLITE